MGFVYSRAPTRGARAVSRAVHTGWQENQARIQGLAPVVPSSRFTVVPSSRFTVVPFSHSPVVPSPRRPVLLRASASPSDRRRVFVLSPSGPHPLVGGHSPLGSIPWHQVIPP